jgi:hypothetical protein
MLYVVGWTMGSHINSHYDQGELSLIHGNSLSLSPYTHVYIYPLIFFSYMCVVNLEYSYTWTNQEGI